MACKGFKVSTYGDLNYCLLCELMRREIKVLNCNSSKAISYYNDIKIAMFLYNALLRYIANPSNSIS
jgi:hypothetical protein